MKPQDTLFAILIAAAWGFNFVASKLAVNEMPPMLANALRFLIVLVVLLPFLKRVPGKMRDLLIAAFTLGVLHFGVLFWGVKLAGGVGSVSIASQLNVPFSTLLAVLILKETVGIWRVAGISLSFAGVVLLGFEPTIFSYFEGVLLVVLAAFIYAVSAILMRRLKDVRAVTTQAWVALAGVVGSLCISLVTEVGQLAAIEASTMSAWLSILYAGVVSTLIGHGGANYLFRKYDVSMVSPYFLVVPLFSVSGGVFVFGEEIGWQVVVGGSLTIVGVLIVTLRNSRRAKILAAEHDNGS